MTERREFLKSMTFASGSLLVPNFLLQSCERKEEANKESSKNDKILVVIQMSGGNDGLNTIVPFRNDLYYKLRPDVALSKEEILKIEDDYAFNLAWKNLQPIYDKGWMSIINNVGYPNPSLSHFLSTDIWETGSGIDKTFDTGWLGRYLDSECGNCHLPYHAIEIDDSLSLALKGENRSGFAVRNFNSLRGMQKIADLSGSSKTENESLDFLRKKVIETEQGAAYLYKKFINSSLSTAYPQNEFGKTLAQISRLIKARTETKIYYADQSSYDTHALQKVKHSMLLKTFSEGISTFLEDLNSEGILDKVLVLVFSEFGRRVTQNGNKGTDHGTANNVFLFGGNLPKPGIFNEAPNLNNLIEDNLKFSIDFRKIYASILEDWMNVDSKEILLTNFNKLPILG
jgi:uncharacterized protein (DUF1501 family)